MMEIKPGMTFVTSGGGCFTIESVSVYISKIHHGAEVALKVKWTDGDVTDFNATGLARDILSGEIKLVG